MAKGRQRQKAAAPAAPPKHLSPQMQQAWRAFDAGDKVTARREAKAVLAGSPTGDDALAAAELLDRLKLPKVALALGGLAGVVIVLLILLAVLRY